MHNLSSNHPVGAFVLALLLVVPVGLARAAGENAAFKDTPVSKFNKDDHALMMARIDQALKAEKEGETLEWKSEKTPAAGSVTALDRLVSDGLPCRRLRIVNTYGEINGRGVYRFCEKPAGKWRLVGPDRAPG